MQALTPLRQFLVQSDAKKIELLNSCFDIDTAMYATADILHEEIFSSLHLGCKHVQKGGGGALPPCPPFSYITVACHEPLLCPPDLGGGGGGGNLPPVPRVSFTYDYANGHKKTHLFFYNDVATLL